MCFYVFFFSISEQVFTFSYFYTLITPFNRSLAQLLALHSNHTPGDLLFFIGMAGYEGGGVIGASLGEKSSLLLSFSLPTDVATHCRLNTLTKQLGHPSRLMGHQELRAVPCLQTALSGEWHQLLVIMKYTVVYPHGIPQILPADFTGIGQYTAPCHGIWVRVAVCYRLPYLGTATRTHVTPYTCLALNKGILACPKV